ncbi:MAG: 16S rRNA (guanine(527)-N(7))-methyltransferase RsmG [Planctomycetes bacterium]|nr:16S rRNA (guanine(527)-N(7))-methyltransferase RsmG [Planctomycetota bacterium]
MREQLEKIWQESLPTHQEAFSGAYTFFQLLREINLQVNLLSRKLSPEDVFVDHILDCALGLPYFEKSQKIMDFGCGGGLPGMILAISYPDKEFVLLDKSPKKVHYLKIMKKKLGLENVKVQHEPTGIKEWDPDTITSRAVGNMSRVSHLIETFLPLEGRTFYFYKARRESIEEECQNLPSSCKYNLHSLPYPEGLKERNLVELRY